jgi:hypothetical protein
MWDEFNRTHEKGSLLYSCNYLDSVAEIIGAKVGLYAVLEDGQIACGVPLLYYRRGPFRIANNEFFIPYNPVLINYNKILNRERRIKRRKKLISLVYDNLTKRLSAFKIMTYPGEKDMRPYIWKGCVCQPGYTWVSGLDKNRDYMDYVRKRKIKLVKDIEEDFEIQESEDWNMAATICTQTDRRKSRHAGYHTKGNLLTLMQRNRKNLELFLLRQKSTDQVFGCRVILNDINGNVVDFLAGSTPHPKYDHINRYLVARILQKKAEQGWKSFNFVGTTVENISQFKEKFHGTLVPYYFIHYTGPLFLKLFYEWQKYRLKRS